MTDRARIILKPFEDAKEYMEDRVQSGIEANRKGYATLRFKNKDGKPLRPVHIEIRQETHDFRFGANCFLLDEMETGEKNAEYKKLFSGLFNLATIPFYWSDLEPVQGQPRFSKDAPRIYRRPSPDLCVEFCRKYGLEPKLHCLNYDQWTPAWLPADADVQTVKRYLDKRIREIAERYRDVIPSMEVINETLCAPVKGDAFRHSSRFFQAPDLVEWSFAHARKYLPYTRLIINEAQENIWGSAFKWNRSAYYMQIERALRNGASIDSIGMQFHMFYRADEEAECTAKMYDPRIIYKVMDQYARFGKPLQITEMTIPAYSNDASDEALQAEILRNLYRIWFSHPAMEAIVYWNLADGYAAFARQGDMTSGENYYHGALVRFDLSKKPSYQMLERLIHEEWHTALSLDAEETCRFKGFYGEYSAEVTANGRTIPVSFHVRKGAENVFEFEL